MTGSGSIAQQPHQRISKSHTNNSLRGVSATPPPVSKLLMGGGVVSGTFTQNYNPAPRIGPGGRRMVKSYSQDAGSSMSSVAATALSSLGSGT